VSDSNASPVRLVVRDANGRVLQREAWTPPPVRSKPATPTGRAALLAWPTSPFAAFAAAAWVPPASPGASAAARPANPPRALRASPQPAAPDAAPGSDKPEAVDPVVAVETLYLDEADQAAFIVASTFAEPMSVRVALSPLVRQNGGTFGGALALRRVQATGSINGEAVPDALPLLAGDRGIRIEARQAVKCWLGVDAHGARPGTYTGRVDIAAVGSEGLRLGLPVRVEVLSLRLPAEPRLALCTWDYVPNRWFPDPADAALDDLTRHGVNVFPRNTLPPARVDAAGSLAIDWKILDAELDRLDRRGRILFHLNRPPIEFAAAPEGFGRRPAEIAYLRRLRDHLADRGRGYADYAFYLLDEPGLDYGANLAVLIEGGRLVRDADPKLQTYTDPVPGLSGQDLERIAPLVDLWAPNMRLVAGALSGDPRMRRIRTFPTVWSYECVGQVKSISPLRYNRASAWRARFFGLSGIGFWTHSTTTADPWLANPTANDEYALVYPGNPPVPSVRWEAVRDGIEDIAALTLLEQQIERHRAAGTQPDLVRQAEEIRRIALADVMELSDETFVESRDFLRPGDRVLGHTATDIELFGRHRAAMARSTLVLAVE
jgi:hypothetical protein